MEPFPVSVFELFREKSGDRCRRHVLKRQHDRTRADDPKHVETAKRIDGNEAFRRGRFSA